MKFLSNLKAQQWFLGRWGMGDRKKILIILASGIGNSILFGPTLKALRDNMPEAQIDIFAYKKIFASPFTGSNLVDDVIYFEGIKTIFELRRRKYDISITAFPSNRWQFNVFAFLVGAKKRVTHSYKVKKFRALSFLQNCKIAADEKLHDVEQNLNLLKLLNIKIPKKKEVFFYTTKENEKYAENFLNKNKLKNAYLIGVHPGAGPFKFKIAPLEKFVELINKYKRKNSKILIFGGKDDQEIKLKLNKLLDNKAFILTNNIKDVAALIKKCSLFISNDTGLMHIATTSKKTKVIALFNGTNLTRTAPYTKNRIIIILQKNKLKYPFY